MFTVKLNAVLSESKATVLKLKLIIASVSTIESAMLMPKYDLRLVFMHKDTRK